MNGRTVTLSKFDPEVQRIYLQGISPAAEYKYSSFDFVRGCWVHHLEDRKGYGCQTKAPFSWSPQGLNRIVAQADIQLGKRLTEDQVDWLRYHVVDSDNTDYLIAFSVEQQERNFPVEPTVYVLQKGNEPVCVGLFPRKKFGMVSCELAISVCIENMFG